MAVSRRKSSKMSPSRMRLRRGVRGDVRVVDWLPVAAIDVVCPGRPGYTCQRLIRFERTADSEDVYDASTIPATAQCTEDQDGNLTFTCRCGRTSEVNWEVVAAMLAGMVEQNEQHVRVSTARLAAIRPPTH